MGKSVHQHCRDDCKELGNIISHTERCERTARHQELFSDLDHFDQLGRVRIQIDHIAGFFGRLRPCIHRDTDVRLGKGWGVIGAVAGHRHEMAKGLLAANESQFVLRLGFSQKVVHSGFPGNGFRSQPIVARDHDRADAHGAKPFKPVLKSAFDDIL